MASSRPGLPQGKEFFISLAIVGGLGAVAMAALVLDGNRPKALRVGLSLLTYLAILIAAASRPRRIPVGASPPIGAYILAGGCAGLMSGLVRPVTSWPIVVVQTIAAALLLGGLHCWSVRSWRRVHDRIVEAGR